MIYVSSSCVRNKKIAQSVMQLANEGFKNIELSGGTQYYNGFEDDLLYLKEEYNLNFLCHNYFPPPTKDFVINLASLDREIHMLSMEHIQNAIDLSRLLGANQFGFHAGFLINIPLNEIGKKINSKTLFDRKKSLEIFIKSIEKLTAENTDIDLFIENNVLSLQNYKTFNQMNPFFLCDSTDYKEFKSKFDFNLLLDVAHLKVSTNSLNLNFESELKELISLSQYIHISDNNSQRDSNMSFKHESTLYNELKKYNFENKIITLEIYEGISSLKESFEVTKSLINE